MHVAALALFVFGTRLAYAAVTSLGGIYSLVQRQLPDHADAFTFTLIQGEGDSFVLSDSAANAGGIDVQCTTASACARGLYTYAPLQFTFDTEA